MTRFTIAVFLHLVGMVGLFIGYGLEWIASSLLRRSTNAEQVRDWLRIYRLSLPISGPGLLLLILSGSYFASITESIKQGWLLSSLLAIVFAFGIGFQRGHRPGTWSAHVSGTRPNQELWIMQRNCGGVNPDSHGTNALRCVGKFVREPNRIKRRSVKNAASPQPLLLRRWCLFRGESSPEKRDYR